MSVWLSYSPSDFLLFTPHTYYRLFELYNRAVWPLHVVAFAFGLAVLVLLLRGGASRDLWRGRTIASMLAACWLWVAWAYLYERYDTINWAARYVAVAFVVQAALLIVVGVVMRRMTPGADAVNRIGAAIVAFALFVQPLAAPLFGRPWVQMEVFGLAPDPTVAATLGALVAMRRAHFSLLVIPLLWCALTGLTLGAMDAPDALVMPAIGVLSVGLTAWKGRSGRSALA
jgi:Family of unknown function (DUF6064)